MSFLEFPSSGSGWKSKYGIFKENCKKLSNSPHFTVAGGKTTFSRSNSHKSKGDYERTKIYFHLILFLNDKTFNYYFENIMLRSWKSIKKNYFFTCQNWEFMCVFTADHQCFPPVQDGCHFDFRNSDWLICENDIISTARIGLFHLYLYRGMDE